MCVSDTSCYDIPWLNRRLSLLTRLYWHSCSPRIVFTPPPLPFAPSILWTFCSKVQIIDNRIILVTGILGIQIQKEEVFNHSWNNFFFQIENNAKHSISSFNFGKYIVESKYTNYNYFTMCNSKMCNYRDLYYTCKINLFYYFRFADLYFHFE